ncbi:sensor histidine kinase [Sphingomonas sp.]|uniref:sensor histidine kinase n=1 Tax=Sphingomonas sp. TaxID=28214 RepID=UPI0025EC19DC|nr:sensor histidine kinase [Sphingomonas sp.]
MNHTDTVGGGLLVRRFADLSTGIKMLAIISVALIPLGLIALLASLQSNRTADLQRRADLRVAVTEVSRKLGGELGADISALSAAADMVALGGKNEEACARLQTILRSRSARPSGFAIIGADNATACGTGQYRSGPPPFLPEMAEPRAIFRDLGIDVRVFSKSGTAAAVAHYPAATIANLVRPIGLRIGYSLTLLGEGDALTLASHERSSLRPTEQFETPVGLLGLNLQMSVERAPIGATELLLTFLPLLMWASAAAVSFLVVDRLLIRPLAELRAGIAGLQPGERYTMPAIRTPAREIRELAETFQRVGETLTVHEIDMAEALANQTRLTREVHHRVKNNLQVIASLISLHARGVPAGETAEAYASIQRRVDALSIVHRNHFAELADGGISIKSLIDELASNLRAGFAVRGPAPAIRTSTPSLRVTQDVAVPVAFLLTELAELSMACDRSASLAIVITLTDTANRALLSMESAGLRDSEMLVAKLAAGYGRIIDGLSRQLRVPLIRNGETGHFQIEISTIPQDR